MTGLRPLGRPRRSAPTRPRVRWWPVLFRASLWVAIGFATSSAITIAALTMMGDRSLVVMSGSMMPVLHVGDLVIDQPIRPAQARIGDIITFRDPEDPGQLITHRVRRVQLNGRTVTLETKGDANNSVQRWSIDRDGRVGRVVVRIPRIGYPIHWANSRTGRFVFLVGPAILLGAFLLAGIWRPRHREAPVGPAA